MTYHLKKSMLLCLLAVVLTMALLTPAVAEVAPLTCGAWSVVSSANAESYNFLNGVAAVSTSNIWAVGYSQPNLGGPSQTLIERWNGTSWRVVSSPSPGSLLNLLNGVAAVSASNIWTVGLYFNGVYGQALIEHWDGMNWSVITSPNPGAAGNGLNGVTVLSASNIWAVGSYSNTGNVGSSQTLIEHWDGTTWSVVTSPNVASSGNDLVSVSAVSANNIWAVGNSFNNNTNSGKTLIEHWNGIRWSIVSSPSVGSFLNDLTGVVAISSHDIWAVGDSLSNTSPAKTLIEHWDGSKWSVISSPNVKSAYNVLNGVAAISSSNIWAAGYYNSSTFIEHWNGTRWSIASSPNVGSAGNLLNGVTNVPGTRDAWTVGFYNINGGTQTLTEFRC